MKNVTYFCLGYFPNDRAVFMTMGLENGKVYCYDLIGDNKAGEIALRIMHHVLPLLPLKVMKFSDSIQYSYLK